MDLNYYPGHMTGAIRKMREDIKGIDVVIEILDARIPFSSKNPDIDELAAGKKRIVIFSKSDLADKKVTEEWTRYYEDKGIRVLSIDSRNRNETKKLTPLVREVCKDKIERDRQRGIIAVRPIKAMVCGIPNVGKSTFINSFVGKSTAKTGNKPGVTRGNQWIRLSKDINMLDTPGILWPKFEDVNVGYKIACIGSLNDNNLEITDIAVYLMDYIKDNYCNTLALRYNIEESDDSMTDIQNIAVSKGLLLKGGEPDIDRTAKLVIDDLRAGRIGRFSLERPDLKETENGV